MNQTPNSEHDWQVHSLNIQGVFFQHWCEMVLEQAPDWDVVSANYPVAFPLDRYPTSVNSALDIRAGLRTSYRRRHNSRDVSENGLFTLLIECKKHNPELVDWVLFPARGAEHDVRQYYLIENTPRDACSWIPMASVVVVETHLPVASEGWETRGKYLEKGLDPKKKTKTTTKEIFEACEQVALATRCILGKEVRRMRELGSESHKVAPYMRHIIQPVVVTTAKLFICEFDASQVDVTSGEAVYNKVALQPVEAVILRHPLANALHLPPRDTDTSFEELHDRCMVRMHILVIHSEAFPALLERLRGEAPPLLSTVPQSPTKVVLKM